MNLGFFGKEIFHVPVYGWLAGGGALVLGIVVFSKQSGKATAGGVPQPTAPQQPTYPFVIAPAPGVGPITQSGGVTAPITPGISAGPAFSPPKPIHNALTPHTAAPILTPSAALPRATMPSVYQQSKLQPAPVAAYVKTYQQTGHQPTGLSRGNLKLRGTVGLMPAPVTSAYNRPKLTGRKGTSVANQKL